MLDLVARKKIVWGVVGAGVIGAAALALWPSTKPQAGYPFARRLTGGAVSPLWKMSPDKLTNVTSDDAKRLARLVDQLEKAVKAARDDAKLLSTEKVDDLSAADRKKIRQIWWSFFEPMVAIDELKERYEHWYGIDYLKHPVLHARAFALTFTALCAQARAGHDFVQVVAEQKLAQSLFDEAMPNEGLPAGTFSALRDKLARTREFASVPIGSDWYDRWIARHLTRSEAEQRLAKLVQRVRDPAAARFGLRSAKAATKNKEEVVKGWAFRRWFPIQKKAATWFGDTRVAPAGRRLVSDAQVAELGKKLEPGDILVERRNWYLSNVGLPGFWPHAALYVGTHAEVKQAFDDDEAVKERFGKYSEHLAKKHAAAWKSLGEKDADGHQHVVIEAVSEGVVATSLVHSAGADYVAALRPRLDKVEIAAAIDRAMAFFGRPYDFNFDFATDDQIVCSELVMKAYEPTADDGPGLRVPYIEVAGRRAIPPTEIVRVFADERENEARQLDFVHFLDGREKTKNAVVADADTLAASVSRPKWDVLQP